MFNYIFIKEDDGKSNDRVRFCLYIPVNYQERLYMEIDL